LNPHLTKRGVWLFVAALIFISAGAITEHTLLLVMGQVQVAVLAASFLMCVVAALVLDRRFVRLSVVDEAGHPRYTTTGMVDETTSLTLRIENQSWLPLYSLEAQPAGSQMLDFGEHDERFHLPAGARATTTLDVETGRCGRWVMQGFDLTLRDPLGLLEARDYLPCVHALEIFPRAARRPPTGHARNLGQVALRHGGKHMVRHIGTGSLVRELRDYQPGDPLRHIAWKATARTRRLISREFEREVSLSVYLLVDISTSMRGGQWRGQKLEHAIDAAADIARYVLNSRDRAGLVTFDEKVYGHLPPASSSAQLSRILRHLVGVNTVVDEDLTEWGDAELVQKLCDYLVVQERLDFRRGAHPDLESGVNTQLLNRWIRSVLGEERERFDSPLLHEGLVEEPESLVRRFVQLRGIDIPYRVEARLGLKERGLQQAIEHIAATAAESQWIVVISDLCGVMNTEVITRAIRLAQLQGHSLSVLAPFTPAYYDSEDDGSERYRISRELFSTREREERLRIASHLRSLGVDVEFMKPGQSGVNLLAQRRGRRVAAG
jgi:uncharacterized protein (DUF58 family)